MIEEHMKENAEDAEDEDAVRARMFEDFENDRLQEDVDDVSIWKHPGHDKRRDSWRKTLLGESETPPPAVLAFYAKIFNDTIQFFLGEMHERIELRAQQEADEEHFEETRTWSRERCSAIAKSGWRVNFRDMEGNSVVHEPLR